MRKKILEIAPVVLSYGCVIFGMIAIILDILRNRTTETIFFLHILMTLGWLIVSIKWTIQYKEKKKEELDTSSLKDEIPPPTK